MKTEILKYIGVVLSVFLLSSCSSGKFYTSSQYGIKELKGLKTFEVKDLKIPFKSDLNSESITLSMKKSLVEAFTKAGYQRVSENPDFTINGELNYFNEGNAALRYFIGYGAGKAKVKFLFKILAKNVDKPIEGVGSGELNMGGFESSKFGGNVEVMTTKIAKTIVNQINE